MKLRIMMMKGLVSRSEYRFNDCGVMKMIRVMIADDERIIRRTIKAIGQWEEYHMEIVGEASNGIEALEIIEKVKPDVLFLDMRMPGYSGSEIIAQLAERNMNLLIVIVSGYDDFEYAKMAIKYGAVDYILKPIDRNEFNRTLKKINEILKEKKDDYSGVIPNKDIVEKIKERIEEEYANDISLTLFAKEFFINKDVLSRIYKKKYGIGITNYINKVRLEQAKVYLLLGYSSTQAAQLVGYHDVNYFSRVFKKYFEMAPTEFIKSSREIL